MTKSEVYVGEITVEEKCIVVFAKFAFGKASASLAFSSIEDR